MKRKLVFATNNAHKLDEISAILGEKVELLSLKDIHCDIDIPETSDTLEGNAMLKAEYPASSSPDSSLPTGSEARRPLRPCGVPRQRPSDSFRRPPGSA